jgi:broad specificity phosphatase PhoE
MQLYFIRHAESSNSRLREEGRTQQQREADPRLTARGQRQATALSAFLAAHQEASSALDLQNTAGFGIQRVYSSLMLRGLSTADRLAEALGLPIAAAEDSYEEGGLWSYDASTGERTTQLGPTREQLVERFPRLVFDTPLRSQSLWPTSYERPDEAFLRAARLVAYLRVAHSGEDERIALVSHGRFFDSFLRAALRIPPSPALLFWLNNASLSRIDFCGSDARLVYSNRVSHLCPDLISC